MSKVDLMRVFAPFGDINDVVIKASSVDHLAHHQSGYGFVDFCNRPEGLTAAVKAVQAIHNRCLDGVNFHVELSRNILKRLETCPAPHQQQQQQQPPFYHSQSAAHHHNGAYYPTSS
ncbi:RNA-binding protein, partial [archaeon]